MVTPRLAAHYLLSQICAFFVLQSNAPPFNHKFLLSSDCRQTYAQL